MKQGIHPKYHDVEVRCACGATWSTRSTKDELHLEICSSCHRPPPEAVDTEGRVERFTKKYGKAVARRSRTARRKRPRFAGATAPVRPAFERPCIPKLRTIPQRGLPNDRAPGRSRTRPARALPREGLVGRQPEPKGDTARCAGKTPVGERTTKTTRTCEHAGGRCPPDVREWLPEGHLAHHADLVDLTAFYAEGDRPSQRAV